MKKLSILFFSLLAVTLFTACNSGDDPVNKQTFTSTINNRTFNDGDVIFSQGSAKVEVNFTNMTIQFTSDYKDLNGQSRTITTPEMKMVYLNGSIYEFDATGNGDDAMTGHFDMATGMLWYTFSKDGHFVVSTSQLLYAYSTTTVTNPDNGNHYSHKASAYLFALDSKGEKCVMKVSNFAPNITGTIEAEELQYEGLNVTPTAVGYTITANQVESSIRGFYTITDLNIVLDAQCRFINGTFKCGDLLFAISGGLFNEQQADIIE
ncbi:MAG: hypothetical protein IJS04_05985 [Muribaculaceae bacterium]|nr:hypothetical protein [Muribaculaceae bacterium]